MPGDPPTDVVARLRLCDPCLIEVKVLVDPSTGSMAFEEPTDVSLDVVGLLREGDRHARNGDVEAACRACDRAAAHYEVNGFHLKAVAVLKYITKLRGKRVETECRIARLYVRLGLMGDAHRAYERAATMLWERGDVERSLAVRRHMCDLDPEDIGLRTSYAEALATAGWNRRAAAVLRALVPLLRETPQQGRLRAVLQRIRDLEADGDAS